MAGITLNQSFIIDMHDIDKDRNCLKFAKEKIIKMTFSQRVLTFSSQSLENGLHC